MKAAPLDYSMLDFRFEIKSLDDAGVLEGYAAVFGNEDKGGDVIDPGAFTKTIQEVSVKGVPVLYQHDRYEPIGVSTHLEEDRYGLAVKAQLNMDVQRARETRSLLNQGAMQGLSIGYKTVKQARDGSVRRLKELALQEFSPVTFPMNELAVATVKAAGDVVWDPDMATDAIRGSITAALNPPGTYGYWVRDVSRTEDVALVSSYSDDCEAWVVPFVMDSTGEITIAPLSDWVEAEQVWVAAGDPELALMSARAYIVAKADGELSASSRRRLEATTKDFQALLAGEPPTGTREDGAAALKETEDALEAIRRFRDGFKPKEVTPA